MHKKRADRVFLCVLVAVAASTSAQAPSAVVGAGTRSPVSFPTDPSADIVSSPAGYVSVGDVQTAFNNARTAENTQLGTSIPAMTLPAQATWDAMNDNARALWLINRERIDRMPGNAGLLPLHSAEANVTNIAQYYAQYLFNNNAWGHAEDGNDPWERLDTNTVISACHDFLNVAENLYASVSSADNLTYSVENAMYGWMYNDSGSAWGHRHAILWYPYTDNSGPAGNEGFVGIGHVKAGPWSGFGTSWDFADIVVMNIFDPCSTWQYVPQLTPRVFMPIVQQG